VSALHEWLPLVSPLVRRHGQYLGQLIGRTIENHTQAGCPIQITVFDMLTQVLVMGTVMLQHSMLTTRKKCDLVSTTVMVVGFPIKVGQSSICSLLYYD